MDDNLGERLFVHERRSVVDQCSGGGNGSGNGARLKRTQSGHRRRTQIAPVRQFVFQRAHPSSLVVAVFDPAARPPPWPPPGHRLGPRLLGHFVPRSCCSRGRRGWSRVDAGRRIASSCACVWTVRRPGRAPLMCSNASRFMLRRVRLTKVPPADFSPLVGQHVVVSLATSAWFLPPFSVFRDSSTRQCDKHYSAIVPVRIRA